MSFWEYANPVKFLKLSGTLLPYFSILAAITIIVGLSWGFFFTPDDYKQGATVKILYVHVPSAFVAINAWFMMLVASIVWLVRRASCQRSCRESCSTYWYCNDDHRLSNWCSVGSAYVGNVVGVGSQVNFVF